MPIDYCFLPGLLIDINQVLYICVGIFGLLMNMSYLCDATLIVSPMLLPKHKLNKDTERHPEVDRPRFPPNTKNQMLIRNAQSGGNDLPQERAYQMATQYQMKL